MAKVDDAGTEKRFTDAPVSNGSHLDDAKRREIASVGG